MSQVTVTSKDNPLARRIRQVAAGLRGAPRELVLAEGIRVVEEAARSPYPLEAVLVSEEFGREPREAALLGVLRARRISVQRASATLLKHLSEVGAAQGVLALVKMPHTKLEPSQARSNALIVCACGIQDPGNLGTLIRSSAAAGATAVATLAGSVSARNPKVVRGSAGTIFHLPATEGISEREFFSYCRRHDIQCLRADPHRGVVYTQIDFTIPTAILLGHETHGVDLENRMLSPVRIPMSQGVESLNVASAGTILLFEAFRQRHLKRSERGS